MKDILNIEFYNRNSVIVAKELLGKKLVFENYQGIITETEAYRGNDDEASHAYNKITPRNKIMYGPAGYSYIYMIYGIYYCLNVVTETIDQPSAVLIRGVLLNNGLHLDGPGKLCKHLGLNKAHNGLNLLNNNMLYIEEGIKTNSSKILITPRIGIKKALEKPWRFVLTL